MYVFDFVNFRYSASMKEKSIIIGLPVVPFNQNKRSDVCQYLEYIERLLLDIYKPEVELCHIAVWYYIAQHLLAFFI